MSWNFALILFVLLVLTGIIWALELAVFRRSRERRAQEAMVQYDAALIGDSQEAERLRLLPGDSVRVRAAFVRGGAVPHSVGIDAADAAIG